MTRHVTRRSSFDTRGDDDALHWAKFASGRWNEDERSPEDKYVLQDGEYIRLGVLGMDSVTVHRKDGSLVSPRDDGHRPVERQAADAPSPSPSERSYLDMVARAESAWKSP